MVFFLSVDGAKIYVFSESTPILKGVFLKIDVFFVVGCKGYLKEKDYEYLQEWTRYQQITLVLIECDEDRLPLGMNKYIIDRDKCVIH